MGRFRWKGFAADEDTVVVLSGLAAILVALVVGAIGGALARDDSGMHQFFAGSGGGGEISPRATSAPEPSYVAPLTIHREDLRRLAHRRPSGRQPQMARRDGQPRYARRDRKAPVVASLPAPLPPVWDAAAAKVRPVLVSLYEDRTLRRGDAVMTTKGIRIFAGSKTFPFRPEDFRNVTALKAQDVPFRRALMELNRLPSAG